MKAMYGLAFVLLTRGAIACLLLILALAAVVPLTSLLTRAADLRLQADLSFLLTQLIQLALVSVFLENALRWLILQSSFLRMPGLGAVLVFVTLALPQIGMPLAFQSLAAPWGVQVVAQLCLGIVVLSLWPAIALVALRDLAPGEAVRTWAGHRFWRLAGLMLAGPGLVMVATNSGIAVIYFGIMEGSYPLFPSWLPFELQTVLYGMPDALRLAMNVIFRVAALAAFLLEVDPRLAKGSAEVF